MFIDHVIVKDAIYSGPQGAPRPGLLYEVVYAANGTWIRAQRPGLAVQIPHVIYPKPLPGLMNANLVVHMEQRISWNILGYLIDKSRENMPNEILFYLNYDRNWKVKIPPQMTSPTRCQPADPFEIGSTNAIVEVHSHNSMNAFFSSEDDRDETGFRIYVVLGRLDTRRPEISVRVGIYGHRAIVPANLVFQIPSFLGVDDVYDGI